MAAAKSGDLSVISRHATGREILPVVSSRTGGFAALLRRHPVVSIWGLWALLLLAGWLTQIARFEAQDADDYMRLLEVRDLLAGQSWFDVTQYRMNPPYGAEMHWSRLVDVPIAVALALFRLFLAEPAASSAAMTAVPLAQLLLVMALEWQVMRALGSDRAMRTAAVALTPLFPLLLTTFAPMRIDHHGWQAIGALACGYFLLLSPDRRAALAAGAVAALWLSVSLQGLPLVVALGAIYALRFVMFGERALAPFLAGLSAISWLVFLATRPWDSFSAPYCDLISWPHMAGFTLAALLVAAAERISLPAGGVGRFLALGCAATLVAPVIIAPLGICAVNPFANLDPVMREYWYQKIGEGMPITAQPLSVQLMLFWSLATVVYGLRLSQRPGGFSRNESRWVILAAYAFAACLISFVVMREGVNAQILAVPFAARVVMHWLPRARATRSVLPRVVASALVLTLATPILASALAKPLESGARDDEQVQRSSATVAKAPCDLGSLGGLENARLFATLGLGPEILARTGHTVVASDHHRNIEQMRDVVEAFSGDPRRAEARVRSYGSTYLVLCLDAGDTEVFRQRQADNLANALSANRPPAWLVPVRGFDQGSLRVFAVR